MTTFIEGCLPVGVRNQPCRSQCAEDSAAGRIYGPMTKVTRKFVVGSVVALGATFLVGPAAADEVRAFPTAEGFGAGAKGGRGGVVYEVTNLNDGGEGSLRKGLKQSGPRTIVFRTGGEIPLDTPIVIKNPYVTIAGQTAPGDGITLRRDGLIVATHDVVIRHIRVRVGNEGGPSNERDGINISTSRAHGDVHDVIVDHTSVSWGIDENISTWRGSDKPHKLRDITVQWTISSEALRHSIHDDEQGSNEGGHSMGMYIGKNGRNISVHHNILAHNKDRNPRFTGIVNAEFLNNVIYNWGDGPTKFGLAKGVDMPNVTHVLNNYYKPGEHSRDKEILLEDRHHNQSKIFHNGNIVDIDGETKSIRVLNREDYRTTTEPLFASSGIATSSAKKAFKLVLENAGAIKPKRDKVDRRIVRDIENGTGSIIDSQNDVGGWPELASGNAPTDKDHDGMPMIGNGRGD